MSQASHNLLKIAQVLKSNGTDGELVISCRDIAPGDINLKEPVFIFFDGLPVPFYIESIVTRGTNKALVHLTDIETSEDADEVTGQGIFADRSSLPEEIYDDDDMSLLVGWSLYSDSHIEGISDPENSEFIGEIIDFLDIPNNPCVEVSTKKGAVTIPLHEDFIISLNPETQEIVMDIPDGLLTV